MKSFGRLRTASATWALALSVPLWAHLARAQSQADVAALAAQLAAAGAAGQGATPPAGGDGTGGSGGTGGAAPAPTTIFTPFGAAPAGGAAAGANAGPVGGGNATDSSSRPHSGDQEDGFDLGQSSGGAGVVHGSANGPLFMPSDDGVGGGGVVEGGESPATYTVRRGDTLWGICDQYLKNPYQWPKIWSYNPQVQNPHWVYPGDELALRPRNEVAGASSGPSGSAGDARSEKGGGASESAKNDRGGASNKPASETVYLRDEGFIDDSADDNWGTLTGSPLDHMFLSDLDDAYLQLDSSHEPRIGQTLTLFRPIRTVNGGKVIQLLGTVRIEDWNKKERVARAKVVESLDVIERGAFVGPVGRSFEVVPPTKTDAEVRAHVIASIHPHNFWGQNQVVFIDKGGDDGLKIGNRLYIVRQGDAWQQSLVHESASLRISAEAEDQPPVEKTPTGDQSRYPEVSFGELRVLDVKHHTATCLLTQTSGEIEVNDLVTTKKIR